MVVGLGTMGVCDEVHDIVGIRSRNAVHTYGGGKAKTEIAEHLRGALIFFTDTTQGSKALKNIRNEMRFIRTNYFADPPNEGIPTQSVPSLVFSSPRPPNSVIHRPRL